MNIFKKLGLKSSGLSRMLLQKLILPCAWIFICGLTLSGCAEDASLAGTVYELSDLSGKCVGVLSNSQADLYATDLELPSENEEPSTIIRYQDLDDAVEDLKTGILDCIIMDASCAEKYCEENEHLVVLEEVFSLQEYSICLGKENTELAAKLNEALALLEENGTLAEISGKYITTVNTGLDSYEMDFSDESSMNSDGILRVATSSGFQPYCYYDEAGNLTGIDIDVAHALAQYLEMEIQITDMDYEALFTSVADGTADFAIAGISSSEDMTDTCLFTDTYTTACQVVLVRE